MKAGTPAATAKLTHNPCYADNKHLQLTDVGHWQRHLIVHMYVEYRSLLGMQSFNLRELLLNFSKMYSFVISLAYLLLSRIAQDLWTYMYIQSQIQQAVD